MLGIPDDAVSLNSSIGFEHELSQEEENRKSKSTSSYSREEIGALCLVGNVRNNEELKKVIREHFHMDILESDTGDEYKLLPDVAFVLDDFKGANFKYLCSAQQRIYGPTVLFECAGVSESELPHLRKKRPLYCRAMTDVIACLSGFRNRQKITELVDLIHSMGGSVRKEFTQNITHMVSSTTQTEKYRLCISMGKPVMSVDWVMDAWKNRNTPNCSALAENFVACHKLLPFFDLKLSFSGFSDDETSHMSELAHKYGAKIVDPPGSETTHFVVDCRAPSAAEQNQPNESCKIVSAEWFWVSIQLDLCANEALYPVAGGKTDDAARKRLFSPPTDFHKAKRKSGKRSFYENRRSMESLFDQSSDISGMPDHIFSSEDIETLISSPKKSMSKRHQVCMELLQTEKNYVEVLRTIVMLFKQPLESEDKQYLSKAEHQLIFGKVSPLFEVHKKICSELANRIYHWTEQRCIGDVWLDNAEALEKSYPHFVNNFDQTKETLLYCDENRPKFHAFLKAVESKAECQRQTLQELLIRPVQRLPSVTLLLNDILKHTEKSFVDHSKLQQAIDAIKKVLAHINEDKRKTEDRVKLISIFQDIENFPVELVSCQRQFVSMLDVRDLNGAFKGKKGQLYTLFLFNDILEVAKKRHEPGTPFRSPRPPRRNVGKCYKHRDRFFLSYVRLVFDVKPIDDVIGLFCLVMRNSVDGDQEYPLQVVPSEAETEKKAFLQRLCSQVLYTSSNSRTEVGVHDYDAEVSSRKTLNEVLLKAVKNSKHGNKSMSRNGSSSFIFSKPHSLRRAVSQAAVTWSGRMTGTLNRMSRTNLRNIFEEDQPSSATANSSFSSTLKKFGSKRKMVPSESFSESPSERMKPEVSYSQSTLDVSSLPNGRDF